ncbi:hypothetical protein LMH87_011336 [Akanthomyces muscarius]|uniref:Uncharacterized protein n=1 Tax=Akanthomyces muscarius TaxID=2231603 RepID=A0A9W8Q9R2_AKAMU|nr:hypothetical protein LMH87_011336 [Akanthomyces muscarius]KAJ4150594.1 hypothetical protein LMH87_011336 [Akanthomyces muscarius]
MASHFQVPAERLSDDDLAIGFSFDARLANKQGQFSGPTPKSIIPGVQSAGQTVAALPAKSSAQRPKLPFTGLNFITNLDREIVRTLSPATRVNDQARGSANEDGSASAHFSHGSDHDESERENATHPADSLCDDRQQSVPFDIDFCSPPPRTCDKRNVAPLPLERHDRPSSGVNKDTSDTVDNPPSHGKTIHRRQSQTCLDVERSAPHRTHSRTSNVSRKRQSGPADYQTSEPDRKRLAMSEAVKYWNELIQISTEESERARATIYSLEKKLQRQANELEAAKSALKTGDTSLEALEKQYQDLQARDSRSSENEKGLQVKFNELSVDYEKLRSQVKETAAKYRSCEEKLESAISEQQNLSKSSRNIYDNLNAQMKQDEARGKANAEAVEKALQASQQKRDELKKFVEHIQHDFQHQKSQYENKIRSLQQENESQGDQLDVLEEEKEMVYSEMISNRCTKACIESVDSKLSGFVTQLRALDASQDTAAIELRNVKTRVEDLPGSRDFAKLKEQVSGSHTKVSDLERVIKESILPAIESIAAKQSESQASVDSLASVSQGGLAKLQEQIQTHAIDFGKTVKTSNESHARVFDLLTLISAANEDVSSRVEAANSRLESLVDGISSQGILGKRIATILESTQGLSESNEKIASAQEKAQEEAQQLHEALAVKIDVQSSDLDTATQGLVTDLKPFETYLAALKAKLTPEDPRPGTSSKSASISRKMLQDVEALRSNLGQVESQLSKIDDVPLSLQKIYDLSLLIQETSKYMDKEERWVHQTMVDRVLHSEGPGSTDKSASQTSSSESSASASIDFGSISQESHSEDSCESQIRKVIVHSPRPEEDSPIRVTTAQEQRRRRESAKPRPILKQSQNQAGAAKTPAALVRSGFHTAEEVIEDIRSALIQSPSSRRTTGLTPMTEYLRQIKATYGRSGVMLGDLADAEPAACQAATAVSITAAV